MCKTKICVFIGVQCHLMSRNLLQINRDDETLNEKLHHISISFPVKSKNHNEIGKKINLSIDVFGYEVQDFLHGFAYYNK